MYNKVFFLKADTKCLYYKENKCYTIEIRTDLMCECMCVCVICRTFRRRFTHDYPIKSVAISSGTNKDIAEPKHRSLDSTDSLSRYQSTCEKISLLFGGKNNTRRR